MGTSGQISEARGSQPQGSIERGLCSRERVLVRPQDDILAGKLPLHQGVYDMRYQKMAEWMENVEKSIARIMADKVYTSAEFKRERDNFHALCKDLEKVEVKKWLAQILEILMAERAASQRQDEMEKLDLSPKTT